MVRSASSRVSNREARGPSFETRAICALLRDEGEFVAHLDDSTMLTLYFAPGSSSFAVHIALHEIGVPFEARPMSFAGKELRAPGYLALNPEGKVPTLMIDGRPLTEVAAILYYLAKRF